MTNDVQHIAVSADFDPYPGGRYRSRGKASGEEFRDDLLIPALNNCQLVEVNLDGTMGYGSSFLEEAFGGLVRKGLNLMDLRQRLKLLGKEPETKSYIQEAWEYITDEAERQSVQAN